MYRKTICFLGPEGVGKTTQACFLRSYFKSRFSNVTVNSEVRSNSLFMYLLSMFLIRCGRVENYVYPGGVCVARVDRFFMRKIMGLWLFLEALAFMVAHMLKVVLPRFLGYTVVLSRHVIDFLTDMYAIGFTCRRITMVHHVLAYVMLRLFFKYDLVVYLDVDYNTLVRRYVERGSYVEPPVWVGFYRRISRKLLELATTGSNSKVYFVDTVSKTPTDTLIDVLSILHGEGLVS